MMAANTSACAKTLNMDTTDAIRGSLQFTIYLSLEIMISIYELFTKITA